MKEEKEMGITKTHIGFIAEEVEEIIPEKVENILVKVGGIKKLSYVKMNSILWGAVREQISRSEIYWSKMLEQQQKIEWLESSVYELIEEIKELKGKKKPKAKAKPKAEK